MTVRKSDLCRHDFIFETPATDEPVFHGKLQYLVNGSRFGPVDFAQRTFHFEHKGRTLWWFQTTISRTAIRSLPFGIWRRRVPVDRIDLNLQYYCGPPRKPICMFKGPFEVGKTVVDETGLYRIFLMEYGSSTPPVLDLHVYGKPRIDSAARALFYAAEGKRHVVAKSWSPADPNSPAIRYRFSNLSPEDIELITIGEEPFEIAVRNLNLDSLKGEHRTYAEHLDKIAERLDLERDPKRLERYRFKSLNEMLKVMDVIRGDKIPDVCHSLCSSSDGKSRLERANISADQLQRLRQTALRWAGAMDPEIRAAASRLGLHCGWPEFVDIALELLKHPLPGHPRAVGPAGDASKALYYFREQLSERDVERIAEILPPQTDARIFNGLHKCLEHPKSPVRIRALWSLANCDQPWHWSRAIRQLSSWNEFDGKQDSLPEELKVRVFLMLGPRGFSDPNQIAPKASDLLLSLLSSELLTHYHITYSSLLLNIPENIDRRVMTDVMIESLRNAEYGPQGYSFSVAISRIVKYLNLWYDVDIGGLNSDTKKRDARLYRKYMDTVASEAVKWYDTVYTGADPNALQ
ncbi:MAG: hypothetical protein ACYTE3_30555 [Planctomycetota bacterium]